MSLTIKNCLYYVLNDNGTSGRFVSGDIYIERGVISQLGHPTKTGHKTIDVEGRKVIPGAIDTHVHFRTPGMTHKEDIVTGSMAAAAGGVTTIIDMPNTKPPTVDISTLQQKREMYEQKCLVNFGFHFGATTCNIQKQSQVPNVASIKVFMGASTGTLLIDKLDVLEKIFANSGERVITIHAESNALLQNYLGEFSKYVNPPHHEVRPSVCEASAIATAIELAEQYNSRLHILHLTTLQGIRFVREAKRKGIRVTCEATPHHLFLNADEHYNLLGNKGKINPPLRPRKEVKALWEAVNDGTVDIFATDHAPHLIDEKLQPYWKAPSGVPGVETMVPLLLTSMLQRNIEFPRLISMISINPARIYGIKNKGLIREGYDADLMVLNFEEDLEEKLESRRLCNSGLQTKCGWSPFDGFRIRAWPYATIVKGNLVFKEGQISKQYQGREIIFS